MTPHSWGLLMTPHFLKPNRHQLLAETDNGYHPTMNLITFLWKLGVLSRYECFFDAEATTNIIYFWLPQRRRSR